MQIKLLQKESEIPLEELLARYQKVMHIFYVVDEPLSQEVDPAEKSPKAPRKPVKKVVDVRSSKRGKKSSDAGASLEAHRSMSSSNDVREYTGIFASIFCVLILTYCCWTELDEEICRLGQ
jgi:hypothetical protein